DADGSTSRDAGTSATARTRIASGRSTAGRRLAARRNGAGTPASKRSTPRPRNNAGTAPRRSPKPLRTPTLRPRVVTQPKEFFTLPFCDRPGCYEPPVSPPRTRARYCWAGCRQAVANVRDRERKWLARGPLIGRKKRAIESLAARRHRSLQQQVTA